ncbi:AP-5 complex subunit zeta-1 [Patella vulgata]|uniref:AP-5 complex subunit zeta-1 n=1 Tax=Patella vulgata TaxID=6465 RepID=UPI00217F4D15|nr:AP-5 complex subunit zeta-1 [Patella vulgata]
MALQAVDNLLQKARKASDEDIEKLCNNILETFDVPDKSTECTNLLRQLFFILQSSEHPTGISKKLLANLITSVGSMSEKTTKHCLLCQRIVKEVMPLEAEDVSELLQPEAGSSGTKNLIPLYIAQGKRFGCIKPVLSSAIRWLGSQSYDFESQRQGFVFLVAVSILHSSSLNTDYIQTTSEQISQWLLNASVQQAANPYTINPFRKDQTNVVNEVDGTPSQNFFTLLNIGQYYTEDQLMNIYSFSMLYKWLYHCHQHQTLTDDQTHIYNKVFGNLASKTVDYCFRLLDQCERKVKVGSDSDLQTACLYEAVCILDLICTIDGGHIPRVHQEIKRLYSRIYQDTTYFPVIIQILQFFLNHSGAVVHDPQETYNNVFTDILMNNYGDQGLMFDLICFIRNNLETLCYKTSVLSTFFPNIFKILAWHPRTFLCEFVDILPALMTPSTSLEIFHTLLDLPCMTAALEVKEKSPDSLSNTSVSTSTNTPSTSIEAYQMALYRPLFIFITRIEGGHGDTINRLKSLHSVLDDMKNSARVLVTSQTVPVLLRVWFEEILENGGQEFAIQLLPVLLERSDLLYPITEFVKDVKRIISDNLVKIMKKYKCIITSQYGEISDFLVSTSNIVNRENFYANLVWCVGEFCSVQHSELCTADLIAKYYGLLEAVTYETSGILVASNNTSDITPKTLSCLISALAKLATRCQDLIPRAILCLTKVAKQHIDNTEDPEGGEILVTRCQELINILKLPNFASMILNPSSEIETGRWHRDNTCLPIILRSTHRYLVTDG